MTGHIRRRGAEAIGLRHHPRGEDAAARTAVDEHVGFVDVARAITVSTPAIRSLKSSTRIGVLDRVAERAAVAGDSARVRVEDDVAVRRVLLPGEIEPDVVHACGPPWIESISGYLRDGVKSGGFTIQPWISCPSNER